MSNDASVANKAAGEDYSNWQKTSLASYGNDMGSYMSNVNGALAAGNPYQSKDYLQKQNIQTSGSMNAANDTAQQQLRDTALRTGTNTAAVAGQVAENARAGQRDLTNYTAGRDTNNEDKWLMQQQGLRQQQLEGANSEAGVFGTTTGGRTDSLNNLTSIQNATNDNWTQLGKTAMTATGAGLTAAFA